MQVSSMSAQMRDRYGVDRGWTSRRITLVLVAIFVLIFAIGMSLQFMNLTTPQVTLLNTGHKVLSDSEVRMTFTLDGEPGTHIECSATAVNSQFAEVGATTFTIDLAKDREAHELILATSEKAASGSIQHCHPIARD